MSDARQPMDIISVIGYGYLQPIADLIEKLQEFKRDAGGTSGYAASLIVLSYLLTESLTNRIQHIEGRSSFVGPHEFARLRFPNTQYPDTLDEIFVVRSAIVHNHVWDQTVTWDSQFRLIMLSEALEDHQKRRLFDKVVDGISNKTKLLGLNLVPTSIGRSDSYVVLNKLVDFLLLLEDRSRSWVYISHQQVRYGLLDKRFVDVVHAL